MTPKLGEHWREAIFALGTVALCLIVESIFSRLYKGSELGWWWIFIIVAMAVLPAVVAAAVYGYFLRKPVEAQSDELKQAVARQAANLQSFGLEISGNIRTIVERGLSQRELRVGAYLADTMKIREIERGAHEIWVITPDFYWDVTNPNYRTVVDRNIAEDKSYTYFCPDTATSRDNVADILGRTAREKFIDVVYVPQEAFGITHFEFVIYDPKDPATRRGILVDLLGTRNHDPDNSIDLFLDDTNLLPRLRAQVGHWKDHFETHHLSGTQPLN